MIAEEWCGGGRSARRLIEDRQHDDGGDWIRTNDKATESADQQRVGHSCVMVIRVIWL